MPDGTYTQPTVINAETGTIEREIGINPFNGFSIPSLEAQKRILSADYVLSTFDGKRPNLSSIADSLEVGDTFSVSVVPALSNSWGLYQVTAKTPSLAYTLISSQAIINTQYPNWDGTSNWGFIQVFDELERQLLEIAEFKIGANIELSK